MGRHRARAGRFGVDDDIQNLVEREPLRLIGFDARDQFIQQDAQRIHVRRRRHRKPAELLRARVIRREWPWQYSSRDCGAVRRILEQFRYAEVEHLEDPVRIQSGCLRASGRDAPPHADERTERPYRVCETAAGVLSSDFDLVAAMPHDVGSIHQLHHQVRLAIRRGAAIEKGHDVRDAGAMRGSDARP